MTYLRYFCSITRKNRMLADFYIPRLSNDMKIAVQKNNLRVKFGTEVWTLLKNGVLFFSLISYLVVIVGNNFAQIFNFFALRTDRESKFVVRFFIFFNYFFELFVHITWLLQGNSENFIYRGLRRQLFRLFLRPFLKKNIFS